MFCPSSPTSNAAISLYEVVVVVVVDETVVVVVVVPIVTVSVSGRASFPSQPVGPVNLVLSANVIFPSSSSMFESSFVCVVLNMMLYPSVIVTSVPERILE